ncbi:hypothetical protein LP417_23070 [Polaromonas sp. P1-6]|nr:hypothetical protein LP417_23070 [Polaromonas sp. P1-6]
MNRGYISRATAENDYGVVVAEESQVPGGHKRYRLDAAASATRRAAMQSRAA